MIPSKTRFAIASIAFALILGGAGIASAQYTFTPGTAPAGGNTITGNGSLDTLNSVPPFSTTGGDFLTINPGATALSTTFQDTIQIYAPNDTLLNLGTIEGPNGQVAGSNASDAIFSGFTPLTIINHGLILGGDGGPTNIYHHSGGDGGAGIYIDASTVTGFSLTNTGYIIGGFGGTGGGGGAGGGHGGWGIYLAASSAMNGVSIDNSGFILGGNGGADNQYRGDAGSGGAAIFMNADSFMNLTILNSGVIAGGNGPGSSAYRRTGGDGGEAIVLGGDSLTNFSLWNTGGTIIGGNGGDSGHHEDAGYGADAIHLNLSDDIMGVIFGNSGTVLGGNGGNGANVNSYSGGPGGGAFYLRSAFGNISGVTLGNTGSLIGGKGGTGGFDDEGGQGGDAVHIESTNGNLTGLVLGNSGNMIGGAGGSDTNTDGHGATGGYGVYLDSNNLLTNSSLGNTGSILGGKGGDSGPNRSAAIGGDAIYVDTDTLSGFTLATSGIVIGGKGGGVGNNTSNEGGDGGNGIEFNTGDFNSVLLINSGLVSGGHGGTTGMNSYYPGGGGIGIYIDVDDINNSALINTGIITGGKGSDVGAGTSYGGYGGYGIEINPNSINGFNMLNSGLVAGGDAGNGGQIEADGGDGIDVYGNPISNFFFTNTSSGAVIAGKGAATGGYGGDAFYMDPAGGVFTNVHIVNDGIMAGGDGHGSGYTGGEAIDLRSFSNTNVVIDNNGVLKGGNSDPGTAAGFAVKLVTNGVVLNNSGAISAGSGLSPVAIQITGNNNTVNLKGHSSVNGIISATGNAGNVLNIAFSGMSPAAQAALITQLQAQGDLGNFTGTFTVRGVTYNIDPMAIQLNLSSYQLQGLTPNQRAIGINLDSITYNPAPGSSLWNLFNAIDNSGNVPGALESLSPQKYEIYGDLAIANSTATVQSIDARLNNLRDGSESIDTTGIGGGVEAGAIVTGDPSKDGGGKESKEIVQTAPQERRWGFFATGDGLFYRGNTHNVDLQEGKSDTAGTLAGIDGKVGEHAVIGTFFAYNNAAVTLGGDGSHATIESYMGGLYGSWHQDGFYANSLAAYTRNNYSSDRSILIPGFAGGSGGSTSGNQATVNLDGGYDFNVTNRLTVGPIAGLQYVHLGVDGFNESGMGAASLAVSSQDMDSLQSRLGGRLDYHIATTSTSSFAAEMYAAWEHEYLNGSRAISAGFEGTGLAPFSIQTAAPLRDAAVVGVSLNFTFHNRLTLFAGYELQMWQASSFEQTINGGAKISF